MRLLDPSLLLPLVQVAFLVGVGLLCRSLNVITEDGTRHLTALVLNVTLPVMLFLSGAQSDLGSLARQGPWVLLAGMLLPILGYGVGWVAARLLRLPSAQASVIRISASLCNTAFVGIPVCTALFGPTGGLLAAIYDQGLNLPLLTLPPMEYAKDHSGAANKRFRPNWRAIFLAPMVWGLVLGIAWRASGLGLPAWLVSPLSALGSATLPLSLVLVGSLAMPTTFRTALARPLLGFLGTRLILVPLAALAVIWLLGFRGVGAQVAVLQTAMPASVVATVMAREYESDAALAASGALLSVVGCLLTIPMIAVLIGAL
jgi:malate permease and related proteins